MLTRNLYRSERLSLRPLDAEKAAEVEANWTLNPDYPQPEDEAPWEPRSAYYLKNFYENMLKKNSAHNFRRLDMSLHLNTTMEMIGFLRFTYISWSDRRGRITLAVGNQEHLAQTGAEAIRLGMGYAFEELNLFRLGTRVDAGDETLVRLFLSSGFMEEVRAREAIFKNGKRSDALILSALSSDWQFEE